LDFKLLKRDDRRYFIKEMPVGGSDSESEISLAPSSTASETSSKETVERVLLEEPMYYVLTQFLESENGKNIATILEDLVKEIRDLKMLLSSKTSS